MEQPGVELTTYRSQVRRRNHSTTPPSHRQGAPGQLLNYWESVWSQVTFHAEPPNHFLRGPCVPLALPMFYSSEINITLVQSKCDTGII